MDKNTRNKIRNMVQEARRLLETEISEQLEGVYGLHKNGGLEDLSALPKIRDDENAIKAREGFVYFIENEHSRGVSKENAVKKLILELAFTHLNRVVALKLMEKRKIIREAISRSVNSNGFKFYLADHPGDEKLWSGGKAYEAYRNFLLFQYEQISNEIKILFDPEDLSSYVFPRERALNALLELLNQEELSEIWEEDETIGWIYQYFTPKEFRERSRRESGIPRDSYELAVRNQFYTPRYVVQFLVDNTLGRMWYEMRKGDTRLKDVCQYLIQHPNEVFLDLGKELPLELKIENNLSQEGFPKRPFYTPHRPKKDPREIRILDPACGSGHFLLYCFDLLWTIYMEAYDDEDLGPVLKQEFPDKKEYEKAVPNLVAKHNLYGIDIDLRSTQITALALFLKAKKLQKETSITKTNVVCAEPMPGERHLVEEFVRALKPAVLGDLVRDIWNKMELADEVGSLLRIEEEIKDSIQRAKRAWLARPKAEQLNLFGKEKPKQEEFDFSDLTDETFWEEAENRVMEALKNYAEEAENGEYSRRLFSEDAARGFSFVDLWRKKYDVVLMNPPFGETTERSREYIEYQYLSWNKNLLCAFVERALGITSEEGCVGVIFDRTAIIKKTYQRFRTDILLDSKSIFALGDTGWGVLDANVETTTMVLSKPHRSNDQGKEGGFINVLDIPSDEKGNRLRQAIENLNNGKDDDRVYFADPEDFRKLPNSVIGYDIPDFVRRLFLNCKRFEDVGISFVNGSTIKSGAFKRYFWEVRNDLVGNSKPYKYLFNGGEYSPFFLPTIQVVLWGENGELIENHSSTIFRCLDQNMKKGICFGKRGDFLDVQILRNGHVLTNEGFGVSYDKSDRWYYLSLYNSKLNQMIINLYCGQHKGVGYVNILPVVEGNDDEKCNVASFSQECYYLKSNWYKGDETNYTFEKSWIFMKYDKRKHSSLTEVISDLLIEEKKADLELQNISKNIDSTTFELYGVTNPKDIALVEKAVENRPKDVLWKETRGWDNKRKAEEHVQSLLSFYLGCIFGYWDMVNGGRLNPDHLKDGKIKLLAEIISQKENELREKDEIIAEPVKEILTAEEIQNAPEVNYPITIDFDGILVDDEGHPDDIVGRIADCIAATFGGENELRIRREINQILRVNDLRDYFRNKFFKWHCKRYNDRPIYWQLCTKGKACSIWLYYHKVTRDSLFVIMKDYIAPKINLEENKLLEMRRNLSAMGEGRQKRSFEKDIVAKEEFISELKEFNEAIKQIADGGYDPNIDHGVILNIASLHKVVPCKEPEKYWNDLQEGKYDWAHIAMKYWPERVREKCKKDKSLAIAHGLEALYEN